MVGWKAAAALPGLDCSQGAPCSAPVPGALVSAVSKVLCYNPGLSCPDLVPPFEFFHCRLSTVKRFSRTDSPSSHHLCVGAFLPQCKAETSAGGGKPAAPGPVCTAPASAALPPARGLPGLHIWGDTDEPSQGKPVHPSPSQPDLRLRAKPSTGSQLLAKRRSRQPEDFPKAPIWLDQPGLSVPCHSAPG